MRSTVDGPPSPLGRGLNAGNNNSNTSGSENSDNSGCQYALCALGVGLVALGIVMIVWSVVPSDTAGNNSSNIGGETGNKKHKVSSVAFVLVGCGVVMLVLSMGLGLMNKHREQQRLLQAQNHGGVAVQDQEEDETAAGQAHRFSVPSYEEAVGSGQYPVRQSNHRPSSSQLPSYDDLVEVDGVEYEHEGSEVINTASQPAPSSTSNCRPGKNTCKLLPIKIRRIKSEKLHLKNTNNTQPATEISIEPLTPPPQYEDKLPPPL